MPRPRNVRDVPEGEPPAGFADPLAPLTGPVRDWFARTFPGGPTPAQAMAWPEIARGENLLLVSPTGTGKTLAAFLAILDRLHRDDAEGTLRDGLQCVYISPLRSLGYDVERNLAGPLDEIRRAMGRDRSPVTVGVRTGDTSAHLRKALRTKPPHLLITTPESLSLVLSQAAWHGTWKTVRHVVVDEIHALVPSKRGADLMATVERLAEKCASDPARIGLSATCRPAEVVARFLVGPSRTCRVVEATMPEGEAPTEIEVQSLIGRDESALRALTYRRLLKRLRHQIGENR